MLDMSIGQQLHNVTCHSLLPSNTPGLKPKVELDHRENSWTMQRINILKAGGSEGKALIADEAAAALQKSAMLTTKRYHEALKTLAPVMKEANNGFSANPIDNRDNLKKRVHRMLYPGVGDPVILDEKEIVNLYAVEAKIRDLEIDGAGIKRETLRWAMRDKCVMKD